MEERNWQKMRVSMKLSAFLCALLAISVELGVAQEQEDEVVEVEDQSRVTYSGYTLYRAQPKRSQQVEGLRALLNDKVEGIEFWTEPNAVNQTVDIMVSPELNEFLQLKLKMLRIPVKRLMNDVGAVIRRTSVINRPLLHHTYRTANGTMMILPKLNWADLRPETFYAKYQPYAAIEAKLQDLTDKNPGLVSLEVAGFSYERRRLYLVKVSTDPKKEKPVIFVDAGHHAREWISHATLLYILETLVNPEMPANGELNSTLDKYDFWFVPVVNPDGYEHTHNSDRLWRKTRSRNSGMFRCAGADPNRNYPHRWREAGASSFSCDETYAGSKPLSEVESAAIARLLEDNGKRIVMYLTLHAYSQVILTPYGYAKVYPDNYAEMERVAKRGAEAIASVRGTTYKIGPSAVLLYPAAGGSDDFAHGQANIKLAYTIELPDTGNYGFLLPPSEIKPVGFETVAGISAMITAI